MNEFQYRQKLNDLVNEATKTLNGEAIISPLIEIVGSIIYLGSTMISDSNLEGLTEVARHRLDLAVAQARKMYDVN